MSSGIVDEAVDLTELFHRLVDQVLDVYLRGHVATYEVANLGR